MKKVVETVRSEKPKQMSIFTLTTRWSIPEPIDAVWDCLVATENWSSWWPYVAMVEQMATGDLSGIGNVRRYRWRTCLPYDLTIKMRVTEIRRYQSVVVEVAGDLIGGGSCMIIAHGSESETELVFNWNVKLVKPWMKLLAGVARPLFVWNHQRVMKSGEQGLIRHLSGDRTTGCAR